MQSHRTRRDELTAKPAQPSYETRVILLVQGMRRPRCVLQVRNLLMKTPGVISAVVTLDPGLASVVYDPAQVTPERLTAALDGDPCGYTARVLLLSRPHDASSVTSAASPPGPGDPDAP